MTTEKSPSKETKSAAKQEDPTIEVKEESKPSQPVAAKAAEPPKAAEAPKPAASAPKAAEAPKPVEAPKAAEAPKPAASAPKAAEPPKPANTSRPQVEAVSRVGRAEAIIRRNVLWSLGAGVIPFPLFDAVAITGVQVKMLAELSELYRVSFREDVAKKIIGALISSLGGTTLGTVIGVSLAKLVPGVGTALGIVSVPLLAGAATHATGKVFLMHFESGGTVLDFDPHAMRAYFKQEFEKAKEVVEKVQKEHQAGSVKPS